MQKHVNLVDLVKSFPTNIYLQNLASIQKRTSPVKFVHLAEKSGNIRYDTCGQISQRRVFSVASRSVTSSPTNSRSAAGMAGTGRVGRVPPWSVNGAPRRALG